MLDPISLIRKAKLTFTAKFLWMLVRHLLSPTAADNIFTWDRAVLVIAFVAGLEIDFAKLLILETHERSLKTPTTYPFTYLIIRLCRDKGVPRLQYYALHTPTATMDIDIIRDEAHVEAPRTGPRVEL